MHIDRSPDGASRNEAISPDHLTSARPPSPPQPASPSSPTLTLSQAQAAASALHEAGRGGWTGWGTDTEKMVQVLKPLRAADIPLVDQQYQKYGKPQGTSLENDLVDEVSDNPTQVALIRALLKGKENIQVSRALEVQDQLEGGLGNIEQTIALLETLSPEERQSLAAQHLALYPVSTPSSSERGVRQILFDRFRTQYGASPTQLKCLQWLLLPPQMPDGTDHWVLGEVRYRAERLNQAYRDGNLDQVETLLSQVPSEQTVLLQQEFDAAYARAPTTLTASVGYAGLTRHNPLTDTRSLSERIERMPDGPTKQILRLRLAPRAQDPVWQADVTSWRMDAYLDGINQTTQLREMLSPLSREQLDLAHARYDMHHPQERLTVRLLNELGTKDLGEFEHLFSKPGANGSATEHNAWQRRADAWAIMRATAGLDTDEQSLKNILAGKEQKPIQELAAEFQAITGEDLKETLAPTGWFSKLSQGHFDELRGMDRLEVEQLLTGTINPKDGERATRQQIAWLRIRHAYETQGTEGVDWVDRAEKLWRLDWDYVTDGERLRNTLASAEAALSSGNLQQAQEYAGLSKHNMESYGKVKDQVTGAVAIGAGVVVAGAVVAGTGFTTLPLVTMGTAGLTASLTTGGARHILNRQAGDSLGYAVVGGIGGASMAPFGMLGLAGRFAGGSALATRGMAQSLSAPVRVAGPGHAHLIAGGAASGGLNGGATAAADVAILTDGNWKEGWKTGITRVAQAGKDGVIFGTAAGAAAGAVPMALQTIKTWRARPSTPLADEIVTPDPRIHTVLKAERIGKDAFAVRIAKEPEAPQPLLVLNRSGGDGNKAVAKSGRGANTESTTPVRGNHGSEGAKPPGDKSHQTGGDDFWSRLRVEVDDYDLVALHPEDPGIQVWLQVFLEPPLMPPYDRLGGRSQKIVVKALSWGTLTPDQHAPLLKAVLEHKSVKHRGIHIRRTSTLHFLDIGAVDTPIRPTYQNYRGIIRLPFGKQIQRVKGRLNSQFSRVDMLTRLDPNLIKIAEVAGTLPQPSDPARTPLGRLGTELLKTFGFTPKRFIWSDGPSLEILVDPVSIRVVEDKILSTQTSNQAAFLAQQIQEESDHFKQIMAFRKKVRNFENLLSRAFPEIQTRRDAKKWADSMRAIAALFRSTGTNLIFDHRSALDSGFGQKILEDLINNVSDASLPLPPLITNLIPAITHKILSECHLRLTELEKMTQASLLRQSYLYGLANLTVPLEEIPQAWRTVQETVFEQAQEWNARASNLFTPIEAQEWGEKWTAQTLTTLEKVDDWSKALQQTAAKGNKPIKPRLFKQSQHDLKQLIFELECLYWARPERGSFVNEHRHSGPSMLSDFILTLQDGLEVRRRSLAMKNVLDRQMSDIRYLSAKVASKLQNENGFQLYSRTIDERTVRNVISELQRALDLPEQPFQIRIQNTKTIHSEPESYGATYRDKNGTIQVEFDAYPPLLQELGEEQSISLEIAYRILRAQADPNFLERTQAISVNMANTQATLDRGFLTLLAWYALKIQNGRNYTEYMTELWKNRTQQSFLRPFFHREETLIADRIVPLANEMSPEPGDKRGTTVFSRRYGSLLLRAFSGDAAALETLERVAQQMVEDYQSVVLTILPYTRETDWMDDIE